MTDTAQMKPKKNGDIMLKIIGNYSDTGYTAISLSNTLVFIKNIEGEEWFEFDDNCVVPKICMVTNSAFDTELGDIVLFTTDGKRYCSIPSKEWGESLELIRKEIR